MYLEFRTDDGYRIAIFKDKYGISGIRLWDIGADTETDLNSVFNGPISHLITRLTDD